MLEVENHQKKQRIRLRIQTSTNLNLLCTAIRSWRISEWLPHLQQAYRQIMEDRQEVGAEIVVLRVKKEGFFIAGSQIVGQIFQDNDQVFCQVAERKNVKKNEQKKLEKSKQQKPNKNQKNQNQKVKNNSIEIEQQTKNKPQITNVVSQILQKKIDHTQQKQPKSENSKQKQNPSQKRNRPIQQDLQQQSIPESKPNKKQKTEKDTKSDDKLNKIQEEQSSPAKDKTQKIADVASLWKKIKEKNGQADTPQKKSTKYTTPECKIIEEEQQND